MVVNKSNIDSTVTAAIAPVMTVLSFGTDGTDGTVGEMGNMVSVELRVSEAISEPVLRWGIDPVCSTHLALLTMAGALIVVDGRAVGKYWTASFELALGGADGAVGFYVRDEALAANAGVGLSQTECCLLRHTAILPV